MLKAMTNLNLYKIPSKIIRQNRKIFHDLHRNDAEPMELWLDRVESALNRCEYPVFAKFLLIDKFMSEMNNDEIEIMVQSDIRRYTWSYKQLREYISDQKYHQRHPETNTLPGKDAQSNDELIPLNQIKTEPVRVYFK